MFVRNSQCLVLLGFAIAGASGACSERATPVADNGPKVELKVAPLSLPDIAEAIYSVTVTNADGDIVWEQPELRSTQFGDSRGSIAYVGPCDATSNPNYVTINSLRLYTAGGLLPAWKWSDPMPVTLPVECVENADASVVFNLTIMRDAEQGFFDVAVNFEDIFCSAKIDCTNNLLLTANDNERGRTIVMAFACTAGKGETTYLHMSDVLVQCDGGSTWIDPSQPKGNGGPVGKLFYQTAFYRGAEQFQNQDIDKCYWNTALGVIEGPDAKNCHILASASASGEDWPTGDTPANTVYPYVSWDLDLTDNNGNLTCTQHPLNGTPIGVSTEYTPITGTQFTHQTTCDGTITHPGRMLCGGITVDGNDQAVAFVQTADGVSLTVGEQRTQNYRVPQGFTVLENCCTNSCCGAP